MAVKLKDIDVFVDEKTGRVYLGYLNKRENIRKKREITLEFSDMIKKMEGNLFVDSNDEIFTIMTISVDDLAKTQEFNTVKEKYEEELNSDKNKSKFREAIVKKAMKDGDAGIIGEIINPREKEEE